MNPLTNNSTLNALFTERLNQASIKVKERALKIGIDERTVSKIQIVYEDTSLKFSPEVKLCKLSNNIIIELPILFLIKPSDLTNPSEYLVKKFKEITKDGVSKKDRQLFMAFFEYIKNPKMVKKAKKFVIHHELVHILHNDIYQKNYSLEKSRKIEKRADITAVKSKGALKGALYLFNILAKYMPAEAQSSHPSDAERFNYLKEIASDRGILQPKLLL